ncbi:PAS domain S-box-containing protein [Catalinimonas alkaloidigena]|uniref:hybrid sensor histidine kinase/response regulator n=1 Tax=Catalinimonas alkaloidigena TaxID=1075417 RepID=UPI0024054239|nr:PAS domain-containing protein [Catalinimonas alkaloidigena]MDF9798148.1 PAS domain S-box-containing protein [Catalinimonas alkaloidigena]
MAYTRAYLERLDKEALVDLFLKANESQEHRPYDNSEVLKLYADQVINLSPDAILLINHETLFLEGCNQAALALLELDTKENLATYLDDLFQDRPVFFEILKELGSALKDYPEVSMEIEFTTSRRNQRWGHMVCKKIRLLENTLIFIRIIDITSIKLTQQQLLESEQRLAEAQQIAQLGSYTISIDGESFKSHYSQTFCQIVGVKSQEEKDSFVTSYLQYIHPDDRTDVKNSIRKMLERKKGGSFEHRIKTKDGTEKHLLSIIRLEQDDEGFIQKIIGTIQDISRRKESEARLKASEERYRLTAENTNDGIWYWNKANDDTYISSKYRWILEKLDVLGKNLEEAKWDMLIHPDDIEAISEILEDCLKGNIPHFSRELRLLSETGEYRWYEAKGTVIMNEQKEIDFMVGAISSIHNRKVVEQKLLQQDRILNFAQHIAKVGSWTWNIEEKDLIFSDELYNIYGIDKRIRGKRLMEALAQLVVEEDRAKVKNFIHEVLALPEHKPTHSIEFHVRLSSGTEKVLRSTGKFYTRSGDGESDKLIGTTQDITEVKQREKELILAKEQAEVSKQAKDRFLQIISHEIRNPLNAIVGISRLLQQADLNKSQEHIKTLNFSASHLLSLINDLLDTAKLQYGKISLEEMPFSITEQLRQTEDLFRPQLADKETTLEVKVDDDIPEEVLGDPTRFNQIIFNLISNAVKYTYRGCVTLEVKQLKQMADHYLLQFVVSDSGVGILSKNLEKIFDAFEQDDLLINQQKGGTGLGLYIVRELVNLMSGNIRVESEFGKGTRFIFTLPFYKVQSNSQREKSDELHKHLQLSDKKVLYVEDAVYNQLLLKGYVKMWNLNLELAANVKEAVEMATKQKYDLVLTDFRLPDGSGEDVVVKLKKINSYYHNIPFIAISAYSLDNKGQRCFNDYIQKPINFDKFFYVLRKYLTPNEKELHNISRSLEGDNTFRSKDVLAFLREHQPAHYQSIVKNMESELLMIKEQLSQSVLRQNYRLYLQMVHKLSSALKIMHEASFLDFLESMADLPKKTSEKKDLVKKLDGYFKEIIQKWKNNNFAQK